MPPEPSTRIEFGWTDAESSTLIAELCLGPSCEVGFEFLSLSEARSTEPEIDFRF